MAICTGFGRHGSGPCPIVPYLCLSVDVSVDRLCVCVCAGALGARQAVGDGCAGEGAREAHRLAPPALAHAHRYRPQGTSHPESDPNPSLPPPQLCSNAYVARLYSCTRTRTFIDSKLIKLFYNFSVHCTAQYSTVVPQISSHTLLYFSQIPITLSVRHFF